MTFDQSKEFLHINEFMTNVSKLSKEFPDIQNIDHLVEGSEILSEMSWIKFLLVKQCTEIHSKFEWMY